MDAGSSPRVRGKRWILRASCTTLGLIPACAGKTHVGGARGGGFGAHPRVCGENSQTSSCTSWYSGSSPRVRGKLPTPSLPVSPRRLIPACAGKTSQLLSPGTPSRAHPRVCGENVGGTTTVGTGAGSSPRVRGKLCMSMIVDSTAGLIPACAGKTERRHMRIIGSWAHPRVCGENPLASSSRPASPGSSPRVRGKPCLSEYPARSARLIPACAGKTKFDDTEHADDAAHPRVCGENLSRMTTKIATAGSSPRVRGKQEATTARRRAAGLIPACAGKTGTRSPRAADRAAHPRVCGENKLPINYRRP